MPNLQTDQSRLDELAESFVERYRRGERPSLENYNEDHYRFSRYPELRAEAAELLGSA